MVMECAGNGNHLMGSAGLMAQARFEGPSFEAVLDACGGPGDASHFAFVGVDGRLGRSGYHYGLSLDELLASRALLAVSINGEALPRARGFPVRLVVPGIYAMSHVKWLAEIVGKTEPHRGIHNRLVYTNKELKDGKWVRVEARWIDLKSMIARCRRNGDGWELAGWAWGGGDSIARVEVTTDGGSTWHDATVQPPEEVVPGADEMDTEDLRWAWTRFVYQWRPPRPGTYMLASRAYAPDGTAQPMEEPPHVRGHFNQIRVKWRRVEVPEL
jgi:DMSO/TMAO reductase YedYZ molybdopterin-dependent catalytic subunit